MLNPQSIKEKLIDIIGSLGKANADMQELIKMTANEAKRLEDFDDDLGLAQEKLYLYKTAAEKHESQAKELEQRLSQELAMHRNSTEELKGDIFNLKKEIEKQGQEKERLKRELKDNVYEWHRHQKSSTEQNIAYANAGIGVNSFAQRLRNDIG